MTHLSKAEKKLWNLNAQLGAGQGGYYYNDIQTLLGGSNYTAFSEAGTTTNLVGAWKKAYDNLKEQDGAAGALASGTNLGAALLYDLNYAYDGAPPAKGYKIAFGSPIPGLTNAPAPAPLLNYIQQRTSGTDQSTLTTGFLKMMQMPESVQFASYCTAYFLCTANWGKTKEKIQNWITAYNKAPTKPSTWPQPIPAGYPKLQSTHMFSVNMTNTGGPGGAGLYSDSLVGGTNPATTPLTPLTPAGKPVPPPSRWGILPFLLLVGGAAAYFYLEHK